MKTLSSVLFSVLALSLSFSVSADLSREKMQKMMQSMNKVSTCMANIPASDQAKLEQKIQKYVNEVDALCKQGKKSQAQKKAIKYSKTMKQNPTVKKIEKCVDMADAKMKKEIQNSFLYQDLEKSNQQVCDL